MIGPMSWRKPQPHDQKKEKQGIPKVLRDPVSQAKDLQVGVERLGQRLPGGGLAPGTMALTRG